MLYLHSQSLERNKYKTNYIQNLVLLELAFIKLFINNCDLYNNSELGKELLCKMEKMKQLKV